MNLSKEELHAIMTGLNCISKRDEGELGGKMLTRLYNKIEKAYVHLKHNDHYTCDI